MQHLRRSIFYRLLEDLFYHRIETLKDYAETCYTSHSTFGRYWRYIKESLQNYGINIIKRNNRFEVSGNEAIVRAFYFDLFKISQATLDVNNHQEIEELEDFLLLMKEDINQIGIDDFHLMIRLSSIRIEQGYIIDQEPEYFDIKGSSLKYDSFYEKVSSYYKQIMEDLNSINLEWCFLLFFLRTSLIVTSGGILESGAFLTTDFLRSDYFRMTSEIVSSISETFKIKIEAEDYFYLIANLYLMIRKKEVYKDIIYMKNRQYNTGSYQKFKKKLPNYLRKNPYVTNYQLYVVIYPLLIKIKKRMRIMVVSSLGDYYREAIENYLKKIIGESVVYVDNLKDAPDAILSDSYYQVEGISSIYLPMFPKIKDIQHAAKQLTTLKKVNESDEMNDLYS